MKLDISEQCFVDHNHHHHFDHYEDENYGDEQEVSPFYTQIIRTHPVQSSTSQNARLLRNDQCAMTNEETRRLTGLVAKTRALFESSYVSNKNLNRKDSDLSIGNSNLGVSSSRVYLPNSQLINGTRNFCKIKQSYSANNVNGLPKFEQEDDHGIYEEIYSGKENRIMNSSNKTFLSNSYAKTNVGSLGVSQSNINNNSADLSAFSRPPLNRVKNFQSPSLSQSHQIFDSMVKKSDTFSNENEISPTPVKKSQSNNRLVFLNNFNKSNNLVNEHDFSRTNDTINSNQKQSKQNLINNGLWSSTIEMREELNIPISVKHAKMCFESLASNKSTSNTRMNSLYATPNSTSNTSSTTINSIHSIPVTPITPSSTPSNLLSSDLLVPTKKLSLSPSLNDQTLCMKQKLSPISRKSSTPSPILSSSSSSDSTTSSDHPISVKTPHGNSIHVSSSNGSVSSGVSEIINLFSSSSTSSNSIKSNRKINNGHVIPFSSSPTTNYNTNSSSSATVSSSSSCETTPRSTLNSKKQRPPVASINANLDLGLSMIESNDFENNKCPSVANKIKRLEQTFTKSGANSATRRLQIPKSTLENNNKNQVKQQRNLFGSSSASSTSSFSSSVSNSFLNNGDLMSYQNKFDKNSIHDNKIPHSEKDKYSTMIYSQSPKFVQLRQSQIDTESNTSSRYRKLEDIISEADNLICKQANLVEQKEKQNPPKSILRKAPKTNAFELQREPIMNQQTSELDNTDDLLVNNRQVVSSLYSSSSSSNFNDSLTIKNLGKNNKLVDEPTNYDHLNRASQNKINAESNIADTSFVKIDNSSCVLPSKLRQRSSSLADSKRTEPNMNTKNTTTSAFINSSVHLNSSNRLAQSVQKLNKAPVYIKNNYSNANTANNLCTSGNMTNNNGLVKRVARNATTAREALLRWCRKHTEEYDNVSINNFSSSWANGLAFCALIHHFMPDLFDYSLLRTENARYNFELAFKIAEDKAGIVQLLDVDDMIEMGNSPDWKCVFTYVHAIYQRFKEPVY